MKIYTSLLFLLATTANAAVPSLNFIYQPKKVVLGEESTLVWSSNNTVTCKNKYGNIIGTAGRYKFTPNRVGSFSNKFTCTSDTGEEASATPSYEVVPRPIPKLSFKYSPSKVVSGQYVTLNWSSQNTVKCLNKHGNTIGTAGSYKFAAKQLGKFKEKFTCESKYGDLASAYPEYEVAAPKPTMNFSYSPQKVTLGESITLNKVSANAARCINKWGTNIGTSGAFPFEPTRLGKVTDTYTCENVQGDTASDSISYEVIAKPTANFSYSPKRVTLGESVTLNKVTTNAVKCINKWGNSISTSTPYVFEPKQAGQFTDTYTCENELGYQVETMASYEVISKPTANFSYSPQKVTLGESVTLNKVTTNAVKCINKWGNSISTNTPYVFEPKQAGQFTDTYTCENELGYQVETTASYEVISKPTANFSYSPQKVTLGESITLNKVTTNAATCTDKSGNSISISAPYVFEPKQTGQFTNTFTCQNELGYQVETTASFEVTPPPAPSLKKVSIKLNHTSLFERAFSINPVDPIEVFDEQIKLNMGVTLQFSFKINNDSNARCKLTNTDNHFSEDLNYDAQGEFTTEITPAYFNERFDLKCADQSSNQFMTIANIVLKSIDDDILKKLANHVLDDKKGDYPKNEFPDEYAEYRLWNTYAQLHNLTDKAFLYANLDFVFNDICKFSGQPNMCESEPEKVRIKNKLAEYLINTSEAFFETCPHPDNDLPIKHVDGNEYRPQCRLKDKAQGYFQWRSPYITVAQEVGKKDKEGQVTAEPSKLTSKHWHMEWRAAGNVAQAIKPFFDLTDNSFDFTSSCPSEELELPSEYKQIVAAQSFLSEEQKYACRANNVKRLLKKHIWDKWLDPNYETRKQYRINGTPMPHFIARTQMIEDLFIHTDDNYTQISRNHIIKDSIREDENSELSNIVCSATDETKCNWPKPVAWKDEKGEKKSVTYNYPFGTAGSMDLNHGEETILVVTQSDALKYCEFKNGVENCFNKRFLAEQLNAKAWVKVKPEANSKGRFDYFLNGYCKGKTKNPINEQPENYLAHHKAFEGLDDINKMQYFCSVHNAAPKPASVVGWVRLAKYNRDLMIKMRSVALEEKALVQTYQTLLNNESF